MLDVDLLDLKDIKGQNYGKRYLLTAVDVFSRKAVACALKNKTAHDVSLCFQNMLKTSISAYPRSVRTDHGKGIIHKICSIKIYKAFKVTNSMDILLNC